MKCVAIEQLVGCFGATASPSSSAQANVALLGKPAVAPGLVGCVKRTGGLLSAALPLLMIAGCAKQLSPGEQALAQAATEAAAEATASAAVKPELTPATVRSTPTVSQSSALRPISFDAIKFGIEKGQPFERAMLTPQIEKLLGKRIRIRGWIHRYSLIQQVGTDFILVRDNGECCYGPGAAIYDCIRVYLVPGQVTSYTTNPIAVEGVLSLEEVPDPVTGDLLSLYRLDAKVVR